jgi:hypothetical protein
VKRLGTNISPSFEHGIVLRIDDGRSRIPELLLRRQQKPAEAEARKRLKAKTDLEAASRRHHGRRQTPEILKISPPRGSR